MTTKRCKICGAWDFWDSHVCPPSWDVRCNEWFGDTVEVAYGRTAEDAAVWWVERQDAYESDVANGQEIVIEIRQDPDQEWVRYVVTGEWNPVYYASKE